MFEIVVPSVDALFAAHSPAAANPAVTPGTHTSAVANAAMIGAKPPVTWSSSWSSSSLPIGVRSSLRWASGFFMPRTWSKRDAVPDPNDHAHLDVVTGELLLVGRRG